ncbi:MAG TPA: STAS domain-containing protein [Rugosimonospora sp.]
MTDESEGLRIERIATDESAMFRLTGYLDLSTVDLLKATVGAACGGGQEVVLDLSGLTFCDSTGVGALVWLYRRATAGEGRLVAYAPRKTVREVLRISGVDRIIPVRAAAGG